jgi:hypothetical protein
MTLSERDRAVWKRVWQEFIHRVVSVCNRRIVLKSPTHTARVHTILEVFPDARFVHIVRDPLVLFPSTVRLWKSLSLVQGLQTLNEDAAWIEGHVLDSFVQMYERFERDRELIPPGHLVDVRYEDLVADPVGQMRAIYDRLELGDFAGIEPVVAGYMQQKRGYRTNRYELPPQTAEKVRRRWAPYFQRYGYAGPDSASASA